MEWPEEMIWKSRSFFSIKSKQGRAGQVTGCQKSAGQDRVRKKLQGRIQVIKILAGQITGYKKKLNLQSSTRGKVVVSGGKTPKNGREVEAVIRLSYPVAEFSRLWSVLTAEFIISFKTTYYGYSHWWRPFFIYNQWDKPISTTSYLEISLVVFRGKSLKALEHYSPIGTTASYSYVFGCLLNSYTRQNDAFCNGHV
jgi:hypothetical protein